MGSLPLAFLATALPQRLMDLGLVFYLLHLRRLYAAGLVWALGMKFAVEEINNSTTLLPGIKLGYEIYDSCMESVVALQASLLFLSRARSSSIDVLCDYTDYQTRVTAVVGAHSSELCIVTAKLFSFFLIPQVKRHSFEPNHLATIHRF